MAEKEDEEPSLDLEWKDYVAIAIAALQTILLPLLILLLIMVGIFIVIR